VNTSSARPCSPWGRSRSLLSGVVLLGGGLLIGLSAVAWGVRILASDGVASLQKIAWIPVPALLGGLLLGTVAAVVGGSIGRRRWGRGVVPAGAVLLVVVAGEHLATRWGWPKACGDPIRIIHWNATSPSPDEAVGQRADLAGREWDVLVVSNDASLFGRWFAHRWEDGPRGEAWPIRRAGPFAMVTAHRVLESRLAIASGGIWLGVFRIELPVEGGREVTIHVLDLPSDPGISRRDLLTDLRRRLDDLQLPAPDLVMGDLNLDAGSRSLATAYPKLEPAFDVAGEGYAASYPRDWPLWQTDQMMVAPDLPICRYRFIDLGFGTHRAQELSIERSGDGQRPSAGSNRLQISP